MVDIKPCPFCGMNIDLEDPDTLYPVAGWREDIECGVKFISIRDCLPEDNLVWTLHCVEHANGCGAEISGLSKEEVIEKWDRRV